MRPAGKRSPPGSPQDWLAHAKSDLNLSRLGKDRQEILPEQVCFHAQQAAKVVSRYPGFWEEINSSEVDEAIRLAERVVAWATTTITGQGGLF